MIITEPGIMGSSFSFFAVASTGKGDQTVCSFTSCILSRLIRLAGKLLGLNISGRVNESGN